MTVEPRWLTTLHIKTFHERQIREHGGTPGLRNPDALEGSLGRVQSFWHYAPEADLCQLAAILGHGLCNSHPFVDGNKRTAFLAMLIFPGLNGRKMIASEPEAVTTMLALASGEIDEDALAEWLRKNTRVK